MLRRAKKIAWAGRSFEIRQLSTTLQSISGVAHSIRTPNRNGKCSRRVKMHRKMHPSTDEDEK
jgi:hypothetical protein